MQDGFEVDGVRFSWGTTWRGLSASLSQVPESPPRGTFATAHIGPLSAVSVYLRAPGLDRPVTTVAYDLTASGPPSPRVEVVSRWLGVVGAERAPDSGAVKPPGRSTSFALRGLDVTLVELDRPRDTPFGWTGGGLYVNARPELLAAPYLGSVVARGSSWHEDSDEAAIALRVDGVAPLFFDAAPGDDLGARLAVETNRARLCPDWLARRVAPFELVLWEHPSGAWGLARTEACWVLSASDRLRLTRALPARGSGWAALELGVGERVVSASGGPTRLDQLVDALRARGVDVRVEQTVDD